MTASPLQPHHLDLDLSAYAGRYIALVEGRVVAVADTPEAARTRARTAREQRPPTILFIAPTADD
ncbi:MAG TPA: hypothetical protein G4N94_08880 [Caldilineae bacterium]|nr:hypothetical protein [Caldilineae bacterium]